MPRKQKKEIKFNPGISYKLHSTSLEVEVERFMQWIPRQEIDLSQEKHREELFLQMYRFAESLALHLQRDFAKASTLGMERMSQLIRSPKFDEIIRERAARLADHGKPELARRVAKRRRALEGEERIKAKEARERESSR